MTVKSRLKHAWNALSGRDPTTYVNQRYLYEGSAIRPDRVRLTGGNERSIVTPVYNRIALDVAATTIEHVRLDEYGRYAETINSGLNGCLTLEANKDQTARDFIMDAVLSLFDEGCIAIVPVDTTIDPTNSSAFDVQSLRTGKIKEWYPDAVRVEVYNDNTGKKQEVVLPKKAVAIVNNPFYSVMNDPNSTLKRLIRKLVLLDSVDEQSGSGKLDLIIQLPYTIKTPLRKAQAEERRKEIERQLTGSKYGIAYTDGTEHITQLNRAVENNLMAQVEYLTSMLYSQLAITTEIMNGTADEKVMANYFSRTIEPVLSAIVDPMKIKFLSKTARSQRQSIFFYRDPFRLVPPSEMADIADKFTRNEIMSTNELRQSIGMKPADDPRANELRNKNLNQSPDIEPINLEEDSRTLDELNVEGDENQNG